MTVQIIDNFATAEELQAINAAWPATDWPGWVRYDPSTQCKQASIPAVKLPLSAATLLHRMASMTLPAWCPSGLIPDLGLWGAGLHEMPVGRGIALHMDAGQHALLGLRRVLSAVLYVTPHWCPTWGGELILPGVKVTPNSGRLALFDCRELPHEVAPVKCPAGRTRRSLALFWYGDVAANDMPVRAQFHG